MPVRRQRRMNDLPLRRAARRNPREHARRAVLRRGRMDLEPRAAVGQRPIHHEIHRGAVKPDRRCGSDPGERARPDRRRRAPCTRCRRPSSRSTARRATTRRRVRAARGSSRCRHPGSRATRRSPARYCRATRRTRSLCRRATRSAHPSRRRLTLVGDLPQLAGRRRGDPEVGMPAAVGQERDLAIARTDRRRLDLSRLACDADGAPHVFCRGPLRRVSPEIELNLHAARDIAPSPCMSGCRYDTSATARRRGSPPASDCSHNPSVGRYDIVVAAARAVDDPAAIGQPRQAVDLGVVVRQLTRRPSLDIDGEEIPADAIASLVGDPFRRRETIAGT